MFSNWARKDQIVVPLSAQQRESATALDWTHQRAFTPTSTTSIPAMIWDSENRCVLPINLCLNLIREQAGTSKNAFDDTVLDQNELEKKTNKQMIQIINKLQMAYALQMRAAKENQNEMTAKMKNCGKGGKDWKVPVVKPDSQAKEQAKIDKEKSTLPKDPKKAAAVEAEEKKDGLTPAN